MESRKDDKVANSSNGISTIDGPTIGSAMNGLQDGDMMMIDGDEASGFSAENKALDIVVICSGDMTDEVCCPGSCRRTFTDEADRGPS